jgi:hypothetical protein
MGKISKNISPQTPGTPQIGDLVLLGNKLIGMIVLVWKSALGDTYYQIEWYDEDGDLWKTSYSIDDVLQFKRNVQLYLQNKR